MATTASAQTGTPPTALSYSTPGVTITEDFNTLATTGTSSSVPPGFGFVESGNNADAAYTASTGSSTAGDTYSFGTGADRALGQLRSGNLVSTIGAVFTNGTNQPLTNITIGYTGEQWRLGAINRTIAERLDFQYSLTTTNIGATTGFEDFNALDFSPPVTTGTVQALDGNAAANRTVFSPVVLTGVTLAPGASIAIRFQDVDATGAEDGLGIDDFSFLATVDSSTPQPTPTLQPTATPTPQPTVPAGTPATALISEYRTGTTASPTDEYIELYNISGAVLNLNGYSLVAGTSNPGTTIYTFTSATSIPVRGHFLLTGAGYSLNTVAAGNATFAIDIPSTGGLALRNPAGQIVDQAGVAGYLEGSAVPAAPASGEYAYVRKVLPGGTGHPLDTGNNSSDFFLVSTTATSATASPRLGAPGPENLASPIQTNGALSYESIFQFRQNAPGGTLTLRRRMTNTSSVTLSNLKLRVVEATAGTGTTANTPIASGNGSTAPGVNGAPALPTSGSIGFVSLTLEAPSPTGNGGVNSTLSAGAITLLPGQSVDVEYTLNVLTGGTYRVVTSFETTFGTVAPTPTPTPTTPALADNDNMLLGNPSAAVAGTTTEGSTNEENRLVVHDEYALGYARSLGGPKWVSWHLDNNDSTGVGKRRDNFIADPDLPTGSQIVTSDYTNSDNYDRGHQCPSGDRTSSQIANDHTFYMSNMLPQKHGLNTGVWSSLETYCRSQVQSGANEAYIISGGVAGSTKLNNKINIPTSCWKVVVILPTGTNDISRISANTRIVAVLMPNSDSTTGTWQSYATTVDSIEEATGLDLLSNLPLNVQTALESKTGNGS